MNWMILISILFAGITLIIMNNEKLSILGILKNSCIAFLPLIILLLLKFLIVFSKNKYFKMIIKFLFNYMNWMIFICIFLGCIMFLILINLADKAGWFQIVLMSFSPILILFFLKFLTKVFKNKWLFISACLISSLYTIIYVLYIFVIVMFSIMVSGIDDIQQYEKPPINEYSQKLETLSSYKHRIIHFPKNIPQDAYNYDFCIENAFD